MKHGHGLDHDSYGLLQRFEYGDLDPLEILGGSRVAIKWAPVKPQTCGPILLKLKDGVS